MSKQLAMLLTWSKPVTMQTLATNLFAAIATLVVVVFPTPNDLQTVFERTAPTPLGQIGSQSALDDVAAQPDLRDLGENPFIITDPTESAELIRVLGNCAFYLSRTNDPDTDDCTDVINSLQPRLPNANLQLDAGTMDPLSESYFLVRAELCRVLWGRGEVTSTLNGQHCLH